MKSIEIDPYAVKMRVRHRKLRKILHDYECYTVQKVYCHETMVKNEMFIKLHQQKPFCKYWSLSSFLSSSILYWDSSSTSLFSSSGSVI